MKYNDLEKNYYSDLETYEKENEINYLLDHEEQILYKCKPNKKGFILNSASTIFPFALLWILMDVTFIILLALNWDKIPPVSIGFLIMFFVFHLTPVWIWLAGILTASRRYKKTIYVLTNKRIILRQGFIGAEYKTINYSEINEISLKITFIDKLLHTGDIYFNMKNQKFSSYCFLDIDNPQETYKLVQRYVQDYQSKKD